MIELGKKQVLTIKRVKTFGVYLHQLVPGNKC